MGKKRPYHHGNLRQALIDGALELIEERGVSALTLREVARRVGVTHAAPQRHFADRAALVDRIADGQRDGSVAQGDPDKLSFAAWSMVHGCAVLLIDGQAMGRSKAALIDAVVDRLYLGLAPREPLRRRPPRRA